MKLFRNSISFLSILLAVLTTWLYFQVSMDNNNLISGSILFVYSFFTFTSVLAYRVSLVKRRNINPIALSLTLLTIGTFSLMYFYRPTLPVLWNYSLSMFVILCGVALYQSTPKNRLFSSPALATTVITTGALVIVLISQISFPIIATILELLVLLNGILLLINLLIRKKKNQST